MYNRLHSYSVHVFRNAGSARVVAGRPSESHDAESDSTSMTRMMSNQSPDPTASATIGDITSRGDMPAEPEYSSREVDWKHGNGRLCGACCHILNLDSDRNMPLHRALY